MLGEWKLRKRQNRDQIIFPLFWLLLPKKNQCFPAASLIAKAPGGREELPGASSLLFWEIAGDLALCTVPCSEGLAARAELPGQHDPAPC